MGRKVIAKEGVLFQDGTHIPFGTTIGINSYGVEHDDGIYPNPNIYDPLRFFTSTIGYTGREQKGGADGG